MIPHNGLRALSCLDELVLVLVSEMVRGTLNYDWFVVLICVILCLILHCTAINVCVRVILLLLVSSPMLCNMFDILFSILQLSVD